MAFKKSKRPASSGAKRKSDFMLVPHPFSEIDPEVLKEGFKEIAQKGAADFPILLDEIITVFKQHYPPHLIAVIAQYGLQTSVSDHGVAERSSENKIHQHHVEILTAISLMVDQKEWGLAPADPPVVQAAMDKIASLADAFLTKRFELLSSEKNEQEKTVQALQEKLRVHTQMVRNWSNYSSVVDISRELYAGLDSSFSAFHGFSASELIDCLNSVVRSYEQKNNDKFQRLKKVVREKSRRRVAQKFEELFPEIEWNISAWLARLPKDCAHEVIVAGVLNVTDRLTVEVSIIETEMVAASTGIAPETVTLILSKLSNEPNALLGQNADFIFLDNPLWHTPFLRSGNSFFSPAPQAAFSHIHRIMRRLVKEAGLQEKLSKVRSKYLEEKVEKIVRSSLPNASIQTGLKWKIGNDTYETDLLAVLDQTVLIVEAKSPALTPEGLRGAPKRVKRHVKELIEEPSEQSFRLEEEIRKAKSGDGSSRKLVDRLGIDPDAAEIILRASITLDDFSILSSSEVELKRSGWIRDDLPLPPTLNIADFATVAEILSEPTFFLHYLSERDRIQKNSIWGDELDYLGFYLETGFNDTSVTNEEIMLHLTGMSRDIDHYYNSKDAGIAVKKPEPKIHKSLRQLVLTCQERARPGWTRLGTALLGVGNLKEQNELFRGMETLRKKVRKKFRNPGHECAMVVTPPSYREFAYVFHVYPETLASKRDNALSDLAVNAMEQQDRDLCIVVSKQIEDWNRPYSLLAMMKNDDGI